MATTGTEKYSRIVLTLVKGGTKLTKKFLYKRIKDLCPEDENITIDNFLQKHRTTILEHKSGQNKQSIFFPTSGTTDLEKWDLLMFCFILLQTCDLTPTLKMYVGKIQKIRNKLFHVKEPTLDDDKYEDYTDKLDTCFNKCLKAIDDRAFQTEITEEVKSFKSGPLELTETVKLMHTFYRMDQEQRKILEKISEGGDQMDEKLNKTLEKLESIESRLPAGTVNVPGMAIILEVTKCSTDKEKEVLEVLVKIFNDIVEKKESLKDDLSNNALNSLREAIEQTFKEFLRMGRQITKVEQKCVMLTVKCDSVASLVKLLQDYRSECLKEQLQDLLKALRAFVDCKDIEFETVIYEGEFWRVIDTLVATLDEHVQPKEYAIQPYMSYSGNSSTSVRVNGVGGISLATANFHDVSGNTNNLICLKLKAPPQAQHKELEAYLETPGFETGMERIQTEVREQLKISNMSITALLVNDTNNATFPTEENESHSAINASRPDGIPDGSTDFEDCVDYKVESYHEVVSDLEEDIDSLLDESCKDLENKDLESAKKRASQATKLIDLEKDKLFANEISVASDDQKVADWYRKCWNLLFAIQEYTEATRTYYSAMIFDDEWDYDEHLFVSDMLWGELVFFNWTSAVSKICQDVEPLLKYLDELAQQAEKRKKWSVCVAIDGDIDTIFYFLNKLRQVPRHRNQQPARKVSLCRQARCYLNMGLHDDVRKACSKVLQEASDYDDTEALYIWASSLLQTKSYDLAFEKCKLALKYVQNETEKEKSGKLLSEIQTMMEENKLPQSKEPDPEWLEGTHAKQRQTLMPVKPTQKEKRKHRRPKARVPPAPPVPIAPSKVNHPTAQGFVQNSTRDSGALSYKDDEQNAKDVADFVGQKRSTVRFENPMRNEKDVSLSETESDEESGTLGDQESVVNAEKSAVTDPLQSADLFLDENETLYDQSLQKRPNHTSYLSFFESGVKLSREYLGQFRDKHSSVLERDDFYSSLLQDHELKHKISTCPQKYVVCIIRFESSHEAYCTPLKPTPDIRMIEISGRSKIGQVFNEDEVVVELLDKKGTHEKRHGKVIGILNRKRHRDIDHPVFLCTLDDKEKHLVRPLCKTVPKIHILNREISRRFKTKREQEFKFEVYKYNASAKCFEEPEVKQVNPGDQRSYIFIVAYIQWGKRHIYPRGALIKILPKINSISVGQQILNLKYNVPHLFNKKSTGEVSQIKLKAFGDIKNFSSSRKDLTEENIFTIDEKGRKDHNYAFSIVEIENGYKIGVHVTDVTAFIQKGSFIDEEAEGRGLTFISGIGKGRHMLPEPLSERICSLLPNEVRPAISVFFCILSNGCMMQKEGQSCNIFLSYIKSKKHMTFEEAEDHISSANSDNDDMIKQAIRNLENISSKMRQYKTKNASAEEIDSDPWNSALSRKGMNKAQSMVKEILDTANKKMTQRLLRCSIDLPLLYRPPPNPDDVEEFLRKSQNVDILLKLQNKLIGSRKPNFQNCFDKQSTGQPVMLSTQMWELISKAPKKATEYIEKDDLHPIQFTTYLLWLNIQKEEEYRCSGLMNDKESCIEPYTMFTSPLRSYMDLVVQRIIQEALFHKAKCPYTAEKLQKICIKVNSARKRAREYQKACTELDIAVKLKANPVMVNAFVNKISDKGLKLCSPFLKYVLNTECELSYNLLDLAERPVIFESKHKACPSVTLTWRKRLYDFHSSIDQRKNSDNALKLNPYKDVVFIPLSKWARMLKCTVEQKMHDLPQAISHAKVFSYPEGLDDVTTECYSKSEIRPNTTFSMTFERFQQVKVQLSAEPDRGILTPKLMLYKMTENVNFCLQHTENPVLHLCQYATHSTSEIYKSIHDYLKRWVPILIMESATGAVRNEESFRIEGVNIHFTEKRKGKFRLRLADCEVRNIEFSGTMSDDEDDEDTTCEKEPHDWLCLKTTLPKSKEIEIPNLQFESVWVGHAGIEKVRRRKENLTINFSLQSNERMIPESIRQAKFGIEVLRKLEVDRRTESFIKMLPAVKDSLSVEIALNKPISELDKDRKRIASEIEHDLYYDVSSRDLRMKQLPKNNTKQQEAIDKALTSRFSLIQGPPGTGKTNTGIKLVYLFNEINSIMHKEGKPKKQVLFCGPSNKSVDLVAIWMLNRMGKYRPNFVRVYGRSIETVDFPVPGRTFQSRRSTRNQRTSPKLFPVALHHLIRQEGKEYADEINKMDRMFKGSNYAPMPLQVKKYVHLVREASIDEIRKHDVILCTTAVGSNPKVLQAANVYQVIVDEAGMCPEPQCLVPIIATKAEQVVLIGDHHQLRPIVMCKEAASLGLETSLFERYAKTRLSKNVRFTMLEDQYRMNPSICSFPSNMFYNSKLKTKNGLWCGSSIDIWPRTSSGRHHHILVHIEGEEETLTVSTEDGNEQSKSNAAEVDHVVKVYTYLNEKLSMIKHKGTIQILSQYNAQCSEIKRKLKSRGFDGENVGTVVSSQGGEWDYVIFSTVRSLPDYKIEKTPTIGWCQHNLGFITDRNQINVAITRARKGLVITGNKNLLKCDKVWKDLIQYYEDRSCIMSAEKFPPANPAKQSKEEEQASNTSYIGKSISRRIRTRETHKPNRRPHPC